MFILHFLLQFSFLKSNFYFIELYCACSTNLNNNPTINDYEFRFASNNTLRYSNGESLFEDTRIMKTNCTARQGQECIRKKQRIPKWPTYVLIQHRKTQQSFQNAKKAGLPTA